MNSAVMKSLSHARLLASRVERNTASKQCIRNEATVVGRIIEGEESLTPREGILP